MRSLQGRGIDPETYLAMTGRTPEQLQAAFHAEAALAVARELALETLADEMDIVVSDDDVKALVREQVEEGDDPEELIESLWAHGEHERLREDLRLRAALDRLVAEVTPISTELAAARETDLDARAGGPSGRDEVVDPRQQGACMSPLIPMVIEQTRAASARSTSTRACSMSGSSSSERPSTTRSPT